MCRMRGQAYSCLFTMEQTQQPASAADRARRGPGPGSNTVSDTNVNTRDFVTQRAVLAVPNTAHYHLYDYHHSDSYSSQPVCFRNKHCGELEPETFYVMIL